MASKKTTTKKKRTRQRKSVKLKQPDKSYDLKPCPFCGGKAEAYSLPWGAGVSCKNKLCEADGPTPPHGQVTSMAAAAKLWNKRK
jgi:hypothetical protein